jgi:hypothetical protein
MSYKTVYPRANIQVPRWMPFKDFLCGPKVLMKVVLTDNAGTRLSFAQNWAHISESQPELGGTSHLNVPLQVRDESVQTADVSDEEPWIEANERAQPRQTTQVPPQ